MAAVNRYELATKKGNALLLNQNAVWGPRAAQIRYGGDPAT
jgi:hypothetical protein